MKEEQFVEDFDEARNIVSRCSNFEARVSAKEVCDEVWFAMKTLCENPNRTNLMLLVGIWSHMDRVLSKITPDTRTANSS